MTDTLAQVLGAEQAARLSAVLGGTQIVVPTDLATGARGTLRGKVGDSLFALLVFHFGGARIYVRQATDRSIGRAKGIDAKRVARLTAKGWSVPRIARHLGTSERTVFTKRAQFRAKSKGI